MAGILKASLGIGENIAGVKLFKSEEQIPKASHQWKSRCITAP